MKTASDLQKILKLIDKRSYPAYKETKGAYAFGKFDLWIDHVQGDPFAAPSKLSVHIKGSNAGFPADCYEDKHRRIAVQDYLLRMFCKSVERFHFKAKGSGKSGLLTVSRCGPEVLQRTACTIEAGGDLVVRLEVGFPANGRTICAFELEKILFDFLPNCVEEVFFYNRLSKSEVEDVLFLADDRKSIRSQLGEKGLAAFVANGSMLPRQSGVSDQPMKEGIPFVSPASMEVALTLPHKGEVKGMGIPKGITLIVGGGYHGKSTLLKALEAGVYDHVAGDGREYVITDDSAVKIRAEDGRSVMCADLSMFVNNLPNGKDTKRFYTEDASGSTSQAAGVVEAIESGSGLLLIDEDTSATNFMVRDELMQRVVHREKEPITPFIERARLLYEKHGISTVIVAGSSGAYFQIADYIIQMDQYVPKEITSFAKEEAKAFPKISIPKEEPAISRFPRVPKAVREERGQDRLKIKGLGKDGFLCNKESVSLQFVEQLADGEQAVALGYLLAYAKSHLFNGRDNLQTIVEKLTDLVEEKGLAAVVPGGYLQTGLAMPRKQEIFACFNRYRGLKL